MRHVVFDLGNVLIGWRAETAFADHFPDDAATRDWMARAGFAEWNRLQDGGRGFAEGLAQARADLGDDLAAPLAGYLDRFPLTIADPVPETWKIAERLAAQGHRLFAITNWGRETWPAALALYPRLATLFEDIVVSGIEGMLKPDPAIYRLLLTRNRLDAADCLFIDDSPANVAGAQAVGMDALLFTDAATLARDLTARGMA